jgi:hypothetical protein
MRLNVEPDAVQNVQKKRHHDLPLPLASLISPFMLLSYYVYQGIIKLILCALKILISPTHGMGSYEPAR